LNRRFTCPGVKELRLPLRPDTGSAASMLTSRWAGIVHLLDIEPTDPAVELFRQARESSG
jgi:hypothetical protein